MLLPAALLLACADPDTLEGPDEHDTAAPDTGGDTDTDSGPTTPDTTPEVTAAVCYPGPKLDWTACVDVVDHHDTWGADYAYPSPYNDSPQYAVPARYVDLSRTDPDLALAPNFVLDEFMQEHKGRYGMFQPHVVETLQIMRDALGSALSINSAYRNVSYNAGVGGATYSRHMYGDAVDISNSSATLAELSALCDDMGAGFISEYTSHVHCDWRDDPLDEILFQTDDAEDTAHMSPPTAAHIEIDRGGLSAPAVGFDEGEPLRRWTAYTEDGTACAQSTGASFVPPAEAVRVTVWVGRQIWLEADL